MPGTRRVPLEEQALLYTFGAHQFTPGFYWGFAFLDL